MATLQYLNPWDINWSLGVTNAVKRSNTRGYVSQGKNSHRQIATASASRILVGAQLPYFEWFVRGVNNDGASKFTDYYRDGENSTQGTVRIVDGRYTIRPLSPNVWRFECTLDIFR